MLGSLAPVPSTSLLHERKTGEVGGDREWRVKILVAESRGVSTTVPHPHGGGVVLGTANSHHLQYKLQIISIQES